MLTLANACNDHSPRYGSLTPVTAPWAHTCPKYGVTPPRFGQYTPHPMQQTFHARANELKNKHHHQSYIKIMLANVSFKLTV